MTGDNTNNGFLISHSQWQKVRKPILSVFVLVHLVLIFFWLFPIHSKGPEDNVFKPFEAYILFFGLDQDWRVFAPKPRDRNLHLVAVVTHSDGALELWEYPRLERMSMIERMYKERYRKYAHDNIAWGRFESFLPDLARFIARLNNKVDNPVSRVSLVRFSAAVPAPPGGFKIKALPPQSDTETIVTYQVCPADLK